MAPLDLLLQELGGLSCLNPDSDQLKYPELLHRS